VQALSKEFGPPPTSALEGSVSTAAEPALSVFYSLLNPYVQERANQYCLGFGLLGLSSSIKETGSSHYSLK
jgi:hypothetical protein